MEPKTWKVELEITGSLAEIGKALGELYGMEKVKVLKEHEAKPREVKE
jgi:hypothetical protein